MSSPTAPTRLLDTLHQHAVTDPAWSRDPRNSVSSKVVRCRLDNDRAVAVDTDPDGTTDTHTQIMAILDLIDLHLTGDGTTKTTYRADRISLILVGDHIRPEVLGALGTITAAIGRHVEVRIWQATESSLEQIATPAFDVSTNAMLYERWQDLLLRVETAPPPLLTEIVTKVDRPELRAYPMLSAKGWWSLRLEGLQIGRFRSGEGWLNVGNDGKGTTSGPRSRWQRSTELTDVLRLNGEVDSVTRAVAAIQRFAASWTPADSDDVKDDEHALESRILRGALPIAVPNQRQLSLVKPDPVVNWGSQFPTLWGEGGRARYLDAMLRDGSTPWALEIKVRGGGGVGQYYRHAIGQAVFYRHFIRECEPLSEWFKGHGLVQQDCRAAVVYPQLSATEERWRHRLERKVAEALDVEIVQVPAKWASQL